MMKTFMRHLIGFVCCAGFENGRLVYMDSFKKSERPASLPEKPHRPHQRRP